MGIGNLTRLAADALTITRGRINAIYDALLGHHVPRNQQGAPEAGAGDLGQPTTPWRDIYYSGNLVPVGGSSVASSDVSGRNVLYSGRMLDDGENPATRNLSAFLIPNGGGGVRIFASVNDPLVLRFGNTSVTIQAPINLLFPVPRTDADVYQFVNWSGTPVNSVPLPNIASSILRLNGNIFPIEQRTPELFWRCGATGCILTGAAFYGENTRDIIRTIPAREGGDSGQSTPARTFRDTLRRSFWTLPNQGEIRFGTSAANSDNVTYPAQRVVMPNDYPITSTAGMHWVFVRRDGTAFSTANYPENVRNSLPGSFPQNPSNGQIVYCSYDGEWRVYTPNSPAPDGLLWTIPDPEFVFIGWALAESNGNCNFARGVIPIARQQLIQQISLGDFRSQTISGFLTQSAPFGT